MEFDEFSRIERDGWNDADRVRQYFESFGTPSGQAIEPTLDAAGVGAGTALLDVCCGNGVLVGTAAARGAAVTGLDFSAAMIADARARVPDATFIEGDATSLPFDPSSFDAVTCVLGFMHIPDQARALAEMRRVLRPGGRLALVDWRGPDVSPGFRIAMGALKAHAAPGSLADVPPAPEMFQICQPAVASAMLDRAGFAGVEVAPLETTVAFDDAGGLFEMFAKATVRFAMMLDVQPPDALDAIRDAMAEAMAAEAEQADGKLWIGLPTALVTARVA